MDAGRFEALLRSFSQTPSRRSALRLLAGSAFGGFLFFHVAESDAHNALKKCKKLKGDKKRACVKKARKHNQTHQAETPPPGGGTTTPPPPPCVPVDCTNRRCGPNGCGGFCGLCAHTICSNTVCDEPSGQCVVTPIPGCCSSIPQCDDGNPCTIDDCRNGTCHYDPAPSGTACELTGGGSGVCNGSGQCVQCMSDDQCSDASVCTTDTCNTGSNTCQHVNVPNFTESCGSDGTSLCHNGVCESCRATQLPCEHHLQCCDYVRDFTGGCKPSAEFGLSFCCRGVGKACGTGSDCCSGRCSNGSCAQ